MVNGLESHVSVEQARGVLLWGQSVNSSPSSPEKNLKFDPGRWVGMVQRWSGMVSHRMEPRRKTQRIFDLRVLQRPLDRLAG